MRPIVNSPSVEAHTNRARPVRAAFRAVGLRTHRAQSTSRVPLRGPYGPRGMRRKHPPRVKHRLAEYGPSKPPRYFRAPAISSMPTPSIALAMGSSWAAGPRRWIVRCTCSSDAPGPSAAAGDDDSSS